MPYYYYFDNTDLNRFIINLAFLNLNTSMTTFEKALLLFDEYNRQDPHIISWEGNEYPQEYFFALQLYNWVKKLEPEANDHLLLASRSQHIGRWKTPRSYYPAGKAGYLTWRRDLAKFHAQTAGELMAEAGFAEDDIKAVQHIILKENLKFDKEVQVMENALCLLFLEFQFEDFLHKHDDDQLIIRILRKTWNKMSEPGRQAALQLPFSERAAGLIHKALAL
jgi:hypothetical protein